ncbi:hypothetical protein [Aquicoccus sp. SU-CL01552]|uniref:hypothetical protein n=1 Tax=Aquicoccus sp. SU-CL01552 TaxID=3127656 RepID=UPI003103CC91
MGLLSTVAAAAMSTAGEEARPALSMQTVLDETTDETEAKRIRRLADFFNAPLETLECSLDWFDGEFPSLKHLGADPLPGAEREFWGSRASYRKWREVLRRRIRATTGELAAQAALRARQDGWTDLLSDLERLSKDDGPVNAGQYGALRSFSDLARAAEFAPLDLVPTRVPEFLDKLSVYEREKAVRALKTIEKLRKLRAVAAHFPENFDVCLLVPEEREPVPDAVRAMIREAVKTARYDEGTYDDISGSSKPSFNDNTAETYEAALVSLARTAAESGKVELTQLNCIDSLFGSEVRIAVIKRWIQEAGAKNGISARSAAGYVRAIAQIGEANGFDPKPWRNNLANNDFLTEGREDDNKMAAKNRRFCEPLLRRPDNARTFLRQHVLYQETACDILATDKTLPEAKLGRARMFGTCAAFAAVELRGAGIRKGSALAGKCAGPDQNLFRRTSGDVARFELRISKKDMKGEYVELPPVPIRDDKFLGYQVLDWYLKEIRPLFKFANPDWCGENQIAISPWLFPSTKSGNVLSGGLLYKWHVQCSTEIGMRMTPHNFRHGIATLLLAKSWENLSRAANYLGCSERVLQTFYAWIDSTRSLEETQDLLAEALSC